MKMAGKLSKLKMPKREEISMEELDMGPAPEMEGEGEMGMESEMPKQEPSMLADISDDDLLAEVKKRGLMSQLEEMSPEEMARDEEMGAEEMEPEEAEYMS